MKIVPITQKQFEVFFGNPDWRITEIPQDRIAQIINLPRPNDVLAVYSSGDMNATKILNGVQAVVGMDVIAHETHPRAGEPELNIYHVVVQKLAAPVQQFSYLMHVAYTNETLKGHWRGADALDEYINLPQNKFGEFFATAGISPTFSMKPLRLLSFRLVNFVPPNSSPVLALKTKRATWKLNQMPEFADAVKAIEGDMCAETYCIETEFTESDEDHDPMHDLTPILIGLSYVLGQSVTIRRSTPQSFVGIFQASEHWPRARSLPRHHQAVTSDSSLVKVVENFCSAWDDGTAHREKALLLIHHWLDALSCWSLEDMYLSATTLLQVIAATEGKASGKKDLSYFEAITAASKRYDIPPLDRAFKDMRNALIHEGSVVAGAFLGKTRGECATVVADVLNWFDQYVHAALKLGAIERTRFKAADIRSLNAFSID